MKKTQVASIPIAPIVRPRPNILSVTFTAKPGSPNVFHGRDSNGCVEEFTAEQIGAWLRHHFDSPSKEVLMVQAVILDHQAGKP